MAKGRPAGLRLETAERRQIEFQQSSLDDLLSSDHRARQVWDYVEGLDLSLLYGRVQTTVSSSGRPAIDPAILVSLWLYATLEGVGSARLLDRLCKTDAAYLWLLGGVSGELPHAVGLPDRGGAGAGRASVELAGGDDRHRVRCEVETLAVDGMRLQAAAKRALVPQQRAPGEAASGGVWTVVRELRAEVDEDPAAAERRIDGTTAGGGGGSGAPAATRPARRRPRSKRQREEQRQKQRRKEERKDHKQARASTIDPQARIMKMADGSFRPAYNVQFKTAAEGAHIVGVSVTDRGSDHGLLEPALDEIKQRYGVRPKRVLADGGYTSKDDIEKLHAQDIELFSPLPRKARAIRRRPSGATRRGPSPGGNAWPASKAMALYRRRFATERPHAHMRNHGLRQLLVRGKEKVKAVVLWHVHAFNFLQFKRLNLA